MDTDIETFEIPIPNTKATLKILKNTKKLTLTSNTDSTHH